MKKILKKFFMGSLLAIGFLASGLLSKPADAAVGNTIAETFPDTNFAQFIANQVSSGDVNAVLTQGMVDGYTYLTAYNSKISDITGIGSLTALKYVDLGKNQITTVPAEIGNLTSVTRLDFAENQITSLPSEIGNLKSLTYLGVPNNQISSLPLEVSNLTNLRTLEISNNQFTDFPMEIVNLPKLDYFLMSNNQITTLPVELGNLKTLKILVLNGNQITSLPSEIGQLTALTNLYLMSNNLTRLPLEIGNLQSLYSLNISNNQITSLPVELNKLTSLVELWSASNLLPSDGVNMVTSILPSVKTIYYEQQNQLKIKNNVEVVYTIQNENDLSKIDLASLVDVNNTTKVFPTHHFILDNYVDEGGNPVVLESYLKDGSVQKSGTIFAQIRATGEGVFPNTSDHAITTEKIKLQFSVPPTQYTLLFDLNGASGIPPVTQSLIEGEVGTAVMDPSSVGYEFDGWNTKADGTGNLWIPGTTPMIPENVVLYAQWKPSHYLVHFDAHGGIGSMTDEDYAYNETKPLFKELFTKEGYTFIGWATTEEGTVAFTDESMFTLTMANNITLYAQWEENVKPAPPSPVNPGTDTKNINIISSSGLPQTGGNGILLVSLLTLGTGLMASIKGVRKK